jgi:O-acetylserine/cysteine efflux transporter
MSLRDATTALAIVLMWSLNLILQKIAVGYLSVFLIGFIRASFVIPFLLLYPKPPAKLWRHAICGFFLVAFYLILFGYGLQTDIGAGISAFILQFQVVLVILCCYIFLGEKPHWYQTLGILVACVGIYFLHDNSSPAELPILGSMLLIASCLSHGIGIALSKKFKLGSDMSNVVWLSAMAVPPLLLSCLFFDGFDATVEAIIDISPIALGCILFATLASTLWGTYLWIKLIQKLSGAAVTPFMLLIPLFSGTLSYFTFGETFTHDQLVSGFFIIFGVIITQGPQKFKSLLRLKLKNG